MTQQATEAAVLLQSGAAFKRRVGLVHGAGSLVFVGVKPGAMSLYFDEAPHFHFDLAGRWQRMFLEGTHYLKSLRGGVDALERHREAEGMRIERRQLEPEEVARLDGVVREAVAGLMAEVETGRRSLQPPPSGAASIDMESVLGLMRRVVGWDGEAWGKNARLHEAVYDGESSFLPPSCPQPIVLRATHGGTHRWLFGPTPEPGLGLLPEEFSAHAEAVSGLLGPRAAQARGIVIAGGDALRRPAREVEPWLAAAAHVFPISQGEGVRPRVSERPEDVPLLDGIYSFLETPLSPHPGESGWRTLRAAGLKRVDIGVVSGDPGVRLAHVHAWTDTMLLELVSDMKGAGLSVGLVVPVGAGGPERAEYHAQGTCGLLRMLPLDREDAVFLVDVDELLDGRAQTMFAERGIGMMGTEERREQVGVIRAGLAERRRETGVKVVPYTMDKQ